jgi:inosine-uridine nucleoside N-ribohydrolase
MGDKTMKILLDTDIGSALDDAMCLAYLLAQPQAELVGITTVSGQANVNRFFEHYFSVF